jgi:hypothetical protein
MIKKTSPIKKEEEVQQNADEHIDQDYPGFPYAPSEKKHITPKTVTEKKTAAVTTKQTEKTYGK